VPSAAENLVKEAMIRSLKREKTEGQSQTRKRQQNQVSGSYLHLKKKKKRSKELKGGRIYAKTRKGEMSDKKVRFDLVSWTGGGQNGKESLGGEFLSWTLVGVM